MSLISELVTSLTKMPEILIEVATSDPVAGAMLAVGGLLLTVSLAYVGLLTLGALLSIVSPAGAGPEYPQAR